MLTDSIPRGAERREQYRRSDELTHLTAPPTTRLQQRAHIIEAALAEGGRTQVEQACRDMAHLVSEGMGVATPTLVVLGVRPHRTDEGVCIYQKFGDYDLRKAHIRLWMKTAMRHQVTSYGTLLSTLMHELCHHLDVRLYKFLDSPHTRGFYQRAAILYHEARGTPMRPLHWVRLANGTYRLNWGLTMGKF